MARQSGGGEREVAAPVGLQQAVLVAIFPPSSELFFLGVRSRLTVAWGCGGQAELSQWRLWLFRALPGRRNPKPPSTCCARRGRRARWRGERSPPELLVATPALAENRHSPPPIRVIAGVKLNHYHRALSICCCLLSLICLSCCRRRHQLPGGDEDTTGAATSRSLPPDCLAIAARFVVCRPTKREERGREALEQN
nr:hypothetical protein Iba_chr09aCG14940 [Ipomoea batatas]